MFLYNAAWTPFKEQLPRIAWDPPVKVVMEHAGVELVICTVVLNLLQPWHTLHYHYFWRTILTHFVFLCVTALALHRRRAPCTVYCCKTVGLHQCLDPLGLVNLYTAYVFGKRMPHLISWNKKTEKVPCFWIHFCNINNAYLTCILGDFYSASIYSMPSWRLP